MREHESLRLPVELPLLALALAIQGQVASKFGGVSLQTIVVTNNIVKFCDAFAGRYLMFGRSGTEPVPSLKEVMLPGAAWLTYTLSAALGALVYNLNLLHFLLPIIMLILVAIDLRRTPDR